MVQTWFNLYETWHKTLFGTYYCDKMVRIEKNSHMLEVTYKVVQTWFVCHEAWHTTLFGIDYHMLEIVICLKLRAKLRV